MNTTWKTILISFTAAVLYTVILINANLDLSGAITMMIAGIIIVLVQIIVGFVLLNGDKTKEIGKGLLIGSGVILLVGFSVCSGVAG